MIFLLTIPDNRIQAIRDYNALREAYREDVRNGTVSGPRPQPPSINGLVKPGLTIRKHDIWIRNQRLNLRVQLTRSRRIENGRKVRFREVQISGRHLGRLPAAIDPDRPRVFIVNGTRETVAFIRASRMTRLDMAWENAAVRAWLAARMTTVADGRWAEGRPILDRVNQGQSPDPLKPLDL